MTCYELSPGTPAPDTLPITAGQSLTFDINPNIYHPGPVDVYMAKAPSTAASFDGKGPVWFKIYGDSPTITSSSISWPSNGKSKVSLISTPRAATGSNLSSLSPSLHQRPNP